MSTANFPKGSVAEVINADAVVEVGARGVVRGYSYDLEEAWCALDFGAQQVKFLMRTEANDCDGVVQSGNGAWVMVRDLRLVEE